MAAYLLRVEFGHFRRRRLFGLPEMVSSLVASVPRGDHGLDYAARLSRNGLGSELRRAMFWRWSFPSQASRKCRFPDSSLYRILFPSPFLVQER